MCIFALDCSLSLLLASIYSFPRRSALGKQLNFKIKRFCNSTFHRTVIFTNFRTFHSYTKPPRCCNTWTVRAETHQYVNKGSRLPFYDTIGGHQWQEKGQNTRCAKMAASSYLTPSMASGSISTGNDRIGTEPDLWKAGTLFGRWKW